VLPCLENLDLPYADDSAAATPTSDDLCTFQNAQVVFVAPALENKYQLSLIDPRDGILLYTELDDCL